MTGSNRHWYATGLLVLMVVLFVAVRLMPYEGYWIGMLRTASEAALVGGLADWFAVVALFRHPLGIPIPHTAVIPNNKDRIGDNLGRFVERNFLDPELVGARLRRAEPAARIATWLAQPANARWLAGQLTSLLPVTLGALRDRELRGFLHRALETQLATVDAATILGRGLALLRESDHHMELFDDIIERARTYAADNRATILGIVEAKSAWWVPRPVDRRVATALTDGIIELLGDLRQRDHKVRRDFDRAFQAMIERLETDPLTRARVERAKAEWLSRPEVTAYASHLLNAVQGGIARDLERPDSLIRDGLAQALQSLGGALARDEAMQARLDERLVAGARALVLPWRHEIGDFIAEVVKSWDSKTISERLEASVGRDLQYIRINGTLVGALVGCLLFVVSEAVF